ncbi:P-loop containing nucleoside triphosphate hydrolase protein [Xylaria sp. CBS 124048]|nr:P-loop containing nucleoside triphosphate hydrolase protein [Xylaria sp. CBS 124048]
MVQPFHIAGAAADPQFGPRRHGVNLLPHIFEKVLGTIDHSRAPHVLAIWSLCSTVIPYMRDLFYTVRHYVRLFFTSAVTIKSNDELYLEVLNWLATQQANRRFIHEYTAHTLQHARPSPRTGLIDRFLYPKREHESGESNTIKYTPVFRTTWFFRGWNLLAVLRNERNASKHPDATDLSNAMPALDYYGGAAIADTITITCLGWSTAPIMALLRSCRKMARAQKRTSVTIRSSREGHWAVSAVKPVRPMDTIHLDEDVKQNLIGDLQRYLDPQRRQFYGEHGIPYRRGYLLHGPPGCGKSSLSLALAGLFGMDLYIVNLSTSNTNYLPLLFAMLPARCFVLLEDIDAVGMGREVQEDNEEPSKVSRYRQRKPPSPCSLSSLLNVLDGVASQEGRVVIMTSNFPELLDEALVRPGRIDVRVFMGHITQSGAEQMFMRMMTTGRMDKIPSAFSVASDLERGQAGNTVVADYAKIGGQLDGESHVDDDLQVLAKKFAQQVPEGILTPAQLQGYLLQYLESATTAVDKFLDWVTDEMKPSRQQELARKKRLRKAGGKTHDHRPLPVPLDAAFPWQGPHMSPPMPPMPQPGASHGFVDGAGIFDSPGLLLDVGLPMDDESYP